MEEKQETTAAPAWRTPEGVHLFGIRHLSAAGAWHVRRFLDRVNPELVLIEGPSDTEPLIADLTKRGVKPPMAILCYTADVPVRSILFPFALYSPEYQCLLWAKEHKRPAQFIDLPSAIKTALYRVEDALELKQRDKEQIARVQQQQGSPMPPELAGRIAYRRFNHELYDKVADLGGESDYDAYWERFFEHNLETDAYLQAVALHSAQMRLMTEAWEKEASPLDASINALREAYMKRRIADTIANGVAPDKIVAVMGAYHVSGVMQAKPLDDAELAGLPHTQTRMTLMPYSYYRLSSFSGYGAGNYAPYYFELMYKAMEAQTLDGLPHAYMTMLSRLYREKQGYSSTASAIEAVRLAQSLQYIHGGLLPTLSDLHDSAVATLAGGKITGIAESFAALDVGTRIGALPDGVSQTPIQDDFNRQMKELRLDGSSRNSTNYKTPVAQTLKLDLRENRRAKSEEAAFRDLERSVFLNRLVFLGIGFAAVGRRSQDNASWAENWTLCWTPEVEISIVESVLYGDTIEAAASYLLKEKLDSATDVLELTQLVRVCCACALSGSIADALRRLQSLASDNEDFSCAARAGRDLSSLVQYGSLRRFDTAAILPLLRQLFLKAALLLYGAASCNYEAARELVGDMETLHLVSQEHSGLGAEEALNDEIWLSQLKQLSRADAKNPLLCGFAFSILLERGEVTEEEIGVEVSRHLSSGNTPEAGAAWFEGLSMRNRQLLLSRIMLWKQLDTYIAALDDEEFTRTLICLRRAFGNFSAQEKSGIIEIFADLWGVDAGNAAEVLQDVLNETESAALDDLKDFDLSGF
ncbi:DUF5682 family protein [Breznakiellaceae bacterium SP9]